LLNERGELAMKRSIPLTVIVTLFTVISCEQVTVDEDESTLSSSKQLLTESTADDSGSVEEEPLSLDEALALAEPSQQVGVVYTAVFEDGEITQLAKEEVEAIETEYIPDHSNDNETGNDKDKTEKRSKLEKKLEDDLNDLESGIEPDREVELVVRFVEDPKIKIPRLPKPKENLDAKDNKMRAKRVEKIVKAIENARKPQQDALVKSLSTQHKAIIKNKFWLVNAMTVALPLSRVRKLVERSDVEYIEYNSADTPLPHAGNYLIDSRALLQTDPYYSLSAGTIGIIDSGIRASHTVFDSSPKRYNLLRDCLNGTSNRCATGTNLDPSDTCGNGHGTATAHIVSGNGNLGANSRGVSAIRFNSFKYTDGCVQNRAALVRAIQASSYYDNIIMINAQDGGGDSGSVAVAADNAYDSGSVVVAAAGNLGPDSSTVASPGRAHKVLAIGAIDTISGLLESYSGRGPRDGRYKPDLLAPTNVHAAGRNTDTHLQSNVSGTCFSTAHAVAATALTWNYVEAVHNYYGWDPFDPGQIYALMIMSGDDPYPDNNEGAGLIELQTSGQSWWWVHETIPNGGAYYPIYMTPTQQVDVAVWWAESRTDTHKDVDIYLVRPNNSTCDSSTEQLNTSVFKKARCRTSLQSGYWYIYVGSSGTSSRTVYVGLRSI